MRIPVPIDDLLNGRAQEELDARVAGEGGQEDRVRPIGVAEVENSVLLGMDGLTPIESLTGGELGPWARVVDAVRSPGGSSIVAHRERAALDVGDHGPNLPTRASGQFGIGLSDRHPHLVAKEPTRCRGRILFRQTAVEMGAVFGGRAVALGDDLCDMGHIFLLDAKRGRA